jgi:hypothetical protein
VSGSNEAFARGSILRSSRPPSVLAARAGAGGTVLKGLYGEQGRDVDEEQEKVAVEKSEGGDVEAPERRRRVTRTWYGRKIVVDDDDELEDAEGFRGEERRKIKLYAPLYSGLAAGAAVGEFISFLLLWYRQELT